MGAAVKLDFMAIQSYLCLETGCCTMLVSLSLFHLSRQPALSFPNCCLDCRTAFQIMICFYNLPPNPSAFFTVFVMKY